MRPSPLRGECAAVAGGSPGLGGSVQVLDSRGAGLSFAGFHPVSFSLWTDAHAPDSYFVCAKPAGCDFVIDGLPANMVPLAKSLDGGIERGI